MLNSATIEQSLHREHFLGWNEEYRVAKGLKLKPFENKKATKAMHRKARILKFIGRYVVKNDRIIPPKAE